MNLPFITIGIVSFKDKKYLEHSIESIKRSDYPLGRTVVRLSHYYPSKAFVKAGRPNFEILIFDNDPLREVSRWMRHKFPDIHVFGEGCNLGFGLAHNFLISKAKADFYLCLNPDVYLHEDFLRHLMLCMQRDPKIACVTGKLLAWRNFPDDPLRQKKQYIDTAGLIIYKNQRVMDRYQNAEDTGQYEMVATMSGAPLDGGIDSLAEPSLDLEEIWGSSGSVSLFRVEALRDVAHNQDEYFDKDLFMYKEDVDLAYRLRWAGWKTFYVPSAVAWHDRTIAEASSIFLAFKERKNRSRLIKKQSFLNQLLFVYKNWSKEYSLNTKLKTCLFLLKYFLYVLFFEIELFAQLREYYRLKPLFLQKRKKMTRRLSPRAMEKWFK